LRYLDVQTFRHISTYPLFFQAVANSFALLQNSNLFFSSASELFAKNHPGWGGTALLRCLDVQTFGRYDAFLISPKVLYFQYRER